MAALSNSDSESSEDESLTQRLQEAVVTSYTHKLLEDDMHFQKEQTSNRKSASATSGMSAYVKLPAQKSLRDLDNNDPEEDSIYNVTPEVRSFIAKKLSEMLERETEIVARKTERTARGSSSEEIGVRLFTKSSLVCVEPCDPVLPSQQPGQKRRQVDSSSSSDSSEDERLASVAVTESDLIRERKMYRRLQQLESADVKDKSNSSSCYSQSCDQATAYATVVNSVDDYFSKKSSQMKVKCQKQKNEHYVHTVKTSNGDMLGVKNRNGSTLDHKVSVQTKQHSDLHKCDKVRLKKSTPELSLSVCNHIKIKKWKRVKLDSVLGKDTKSSLQKNRE